MQVAISAAKAVLTELARRAEEGETVFLTRHGRPVARIAPLEHDRPARGGDDRLARLRAMAEQGRAIRLAEGFTGKQLQDELYDDRGAPV